LLENPEGQAQVVGKVEASWKCQKKKQATRNKKQWQIRLLHHLHLKQHLHSPLLLVVVMD